MLTTLEFREITAAVDHFVKLGYRICNYSDRSRTMTNGTKMAYIIRTDFFKVVAQF